MILNGIVAGGEQSIKLRLAQAEVHRCGVGLVGARRAEHEGFHLVALERLFLPRDEHHPRGQLGLQVRELLLLRGHLGFLCFQRRLQLVLLLQRVEHQQFALGLGHGAVAALKRSGRSSCVGRASCRGCSRRCNPIGRWRGGRPLDRVAVLCKMSEVLAEAAHAVGTRRQ